ncbi:unnamed protein product, partial [Owenia fusiformis]
VGWYITHQSSTVFINLQVQPNIKVYTLRVPVVHHVDPNLHLKCYFHGNCCKYEITKPGGYAVKNYGVYGRDTYGYGEKSYGIRRTGYAPNYAGYGDKSYGRRYLGYKVKGYENYGPGYAGARYAGYRPAAYGYGYNKNVPYGDAFPYKNVGPNGAVVNSPSGLIVGDNGGYIDGQTGAVVGPNGAVAGSGYVRRGYVY